MSSPTNGSPTNEPTMEVELPPSPKPTSHNTPTTLANADTMTTNCEDPAVHPESPSTNPTMLTHRLQLEFKPNQKMKPSSNKQVFDETTSIKSFITMLFNTFPNSSILIPESNTAFHTIAAFPHNETTFNKYLTVTQLQKRSSVFVYFLLHSSHLLCDIKNNQPIFDYVCSNKISISHQGVARADESVPLGTIFFAHPFLTNKTQLITTINKTCQKWLDNVSLDKINSFSHLTDAKKMRNNVPSFDISQWPITSPEKDHNNNKVTTNALHITTHRSDAVWLSTLLTETINPTSPLGYQFTPYSIKRSHPQTYHQLITVHNAYLHSLCSMPICGVPSHTLDTPFPNKPSIRTQLLTRKATSNHNLMLIYSIETTNQTNEIGKHFILYHKDNEAQVIQYIDTEFSQQCNEIKYRTQHPTH